MRGSGILLLILCCPILMIGCSKSKRADREAGPWKPEAARPMDDPAPMVAGNKPKSKNPKVVEPQSGILTAGSFDDNLEPNEFRDFIRTIGQLPGTESAGKLSGKNLALTIQDGNGKPVGNARVHIRGVDNGQGVQLLSRSDGRVICLTSFDSLPADEDLLVTVSPPDRSKPITRRVPRRANHYVITLPAVQSALPQRLDLAIVLDTTASMSDEMRFLKSELRSIATAIATRFPNVQQRYGLVAYRDRGDAYVTRLFPFTKSLEKFRADLHKQQAAGGGDRPEAVHLGLEDALELTWSKDNTARVLFLVADAPPHRQFAKRTLKAMDSLRKKGVAIYPVASSDADGTCEFFMRAGAMLTGGQYLFLTDDSGVGNPHAEPNVRGYHVQRLDHLMIRMIAGELSGKRIAPRPDRIIRTVGRPAVLQQ